MLPRFSAVLIHRVKLEMVGYLAIEPKASEIERPF